MTTDHTRAAANECLALVKQQADRINDATEWDQGWTEREFGQRPIDTLESGFAAIIREAIAATTAELDAERVISSAKDMSLDILRHDLAAMQAERDALRAQLAESEQEAGAMRKALAATILFREFMDEWHDMNNAEVVEFRRLRDAALATDAGRKAIEERERWRKAIEAVIAAPDIPTNTSECNEVRAAKAAAREALKGKP